MTHPVRSKLVRTAASAVAALSLAAAVVATGGPNRRGVPTSEAVAVKLAANTDKANGNFTFTITGRVENLYPGGPSQLALTVANPNQFDIRVTRITVAVGPAGAGCTAAFLSVPASTALSLVVGGRGTAPVSLPVRLLATAPDSCQRASFPLTYGGTAEKA